MRQALETFHFQIAEKTSKYSIRFLQTLTILSDNMAMASTIQNQTREATYTRHVSCPIFASHTYTCGQNEPTTLAEEGQLHLTFHLRSPQKKLRQIYGENPQENLNFSRTRLQTLISNPVTSAPCSETAGNILLTRQNRDVIAQ